jgi:hypothetical protein
VAALLAGVIGLSPTTVRVVRYVCMLGIMLVVWLLIFQVCTVNVPTISI